MYKFVQTIKRFRLSKKVAWAIFIWIILLIVVQGFLWNAANKQHQEIAKKVVMYLYDFGTVEQLEEQQIWLESLVTTYVYNQLTYDNEEMRLNTYLKFSGNASTVEFIEVTDDHIIYSIDCGYLMDGRKFLFQYHLDSNGKIDQVYEAELIDFLDGGD